MQPWTFYALFLFNAAFRKMQEKVSHDCMLSYILQKIFFDDFWFFENKEIYKEIVLLW